MASQSSVEKGNSFRDYVSNLLAAANFYPTTETREDFKKVDIRCTVEDVDGSSTIFVEAKDYNGTLGSGECTEFSTQYGQLVSSGRADKAWLISKGSISPDGRALIESNKHLKCFTIEEFQRRLFRVDAYLQEIISDYETDRIREYYIPPYTEEDQDLVSVVNDWLTKENAPPLAVMGGYGKGKSTFARNLAYNLAKEAIEDRAKRVPVLVRLGQIVDQQSIEGLICTLFSSQYRAGGFHYSLFKPLNMAGQFLIILDGFDEMKHGMTLHMFQQNWKSFMKLDEGKAKILILGRDTAFHDDREFKSIIKGRDFTLSGQEIPARDRRECQAVKLRGFTLEEAKQYVQKYFPIKVEEVFRDKAEKPNSAWIQERLNELQSEGFNGLLIRPVHAQMLCEIATQPSINIQSLSRYDLYDRFVHYLLDREIDKQGRYPNFTNNIRRQFNSELAWWLWDKGAASTTSLSDVPSTICVQVTDGVEHDFDETGLKRELTAGCLIEKSAGTIYFGHRSIQEFLVSDHLFSNNLLHSSELDTKNFTNVINSIDTEIVDFLSTRVQHDSGNGAIASRWLSYLEGWRAQGISLQGFELFVRMAYITGFRHQDWVSPWHVWINYFLSNDQTTFRIVGSKAAKCLEKIISEGILKKDEVIQAASLHTLARAFLLSSDKRQDLLPYLIALWLPRDRIKMALGEVRKGKNNSSFVRRSEDYALWALLNTVEFTRGESRELHLRLDLRKLEQLTSQSIGFGLALESLSGVEGDASFFECKMQPIYSAYTRLQVSDNELDDIRPFFNDDSLRSRIRPYSVQVRR